MTFTANSKHIPQFHTKLFTANTNIFTVLYKQLKIDANSFILRFSFAVNLMLNVESILN